MGKKLLSLLLALVMVVMVLPVTALAADDNAVYVGRPTTASIDVEVQGGTWECVVSYDSGVQELKLNGKDCKNGEAIGKLESIFGTSGSYRFDVVFSAAGSHTITVTATRTFPAKTVVKSVAIDVQACKHEAGEVVDEGKEATCLEPGVVKQFQCKYCDAVVNENGEVVTETQIPAKQHSFGEKYHSASPATCSANGYDDCWQCANCGLFFASNGDWYSSQGKKTDESFVHEMAPNNHVNQETGEAYKHIEVPYNAPTCTKDGNEAYWKCEGCEKCFDAKTGEKKDASAFTIKKLGHDWKNGDSTLGLEYQYCANCGKLKIDGTAVDAIPGLHTLTFHEGHPATCTENGEIDYWYCTDTDCGMKFKNLEATQPLKDKDLVIKAEDHKLQTLVNSNCKVCSVCGLYFDAEGKQVEKPKDVGAHVLLHHEEVAPNCKVGNGNIEYWECIDCGDCFNNEDGAAGHLISRNTLAVAYVANNAGHHDLDHIQDAEHIEHWKCKDCGMCFDESKENVLDPSQLGAIVASGDHSLKFIPEVPATCTSSGTRAHWVCMSSHNCAKYFEDSAANKPLTKDQLVTTVEHSWLHFNGIPATMDGKGQQGYSYCTKCHMYKLDGSDTLYTEEELRQNWGIETLPDKGEAVPYKKVAPTCTEPGMKKHWEVKNLRDDSILYYLDAAMSQSTTLDALTIPAAGHKWVLVGETATTKAHKECSVCHAWADADTTDPTAPGEPEEGFGKPTPEGVIKDDMDLSGMHMSTILGKGNEP